MATYAALVKRKIDVRKAGKPIILHSAEPSASSGLPASGMQAGRSTTVTFSARLASISASDVEPHRLRSSYGRLPANQAKDGGPLACLASQLLLLALSSMTCYVNSLHT